MKTHKGSGAVQLLLAALLGTLCTVVVMLILLIPASWLISAGKAGEELMPAILLAISLLSALLGGYFARKKAKSRILLVCSSTGVFSFLLLFTAGKLVFGGAGTGSQTLLIFLTLFVGALLSGLFCLFKKKRRK